MANNNILLEPNKIYHIYNRGIDSCKIFEDNYNYERFISLLQRYLPVIAECYAWAFLKNHFHFIVHIKAEEEILINQKLFRQKELSPIDRIYQQLSNMFNAYARYYNLRKGRTGGLFESNFKRIEIDSEKYLQNLLVYVHNNPVHHKLCKHPIEYPWSSYVSYLDHESKGVFPEKVKSLFNDIRHYKTLHTRNLKKSVIEEDFFD